MKIGIIGSGAMGCLYGGKLSVLDENEVIFMDVWQDHVDAINEKGLLMEEGGEVLTYNRVKAYTDAEKVGPCDLVIVFVKSTMTKKAVESNRALFDKNTLVLTLQNGLGNVEQIEEVLGSGNVLAGTTAHGATMLEPGKMRHAGSGKTIIGELSGEITPRLSALADMFNKASLDGQTSENVLGLIWDKLLVNVGINPLTALTGLLNGELLDYPEIVAIMEGAVEEARDVAVALGVNLGYDDPVAHTKDVCKATAANRSSMLQDVSNGRPTEISMINGAVCREGEKVGIETPMNSVLTNLILFKQRNII